MQSKRVLIVFISFIVTVLLVWAGLFIAVEVMRYNSIDCNDIRRRELDANKKNSLSIRDNKVTDWSPEIVKKCF